MCDYYRLLEETVRKSKKTNKQAQQSNLIQSNYKFNAIDTSRLQKAQQELMI